MKVHTVDGAEVEITMEEALRIHAAVTPHKTTHFFRDYQHTAADNIRKALGVEKLPVTEPEIKAAIAIAADVGDPDMIAEIVFEAMEWETAYAHLKSAE